MKLTVAGFVNVAIMVTAAAAFHNGHSNIASISDTYKMLVPLFGAAACIFFVITLLTPAFPYPSSEL